MHRIDGSSTRSAYRNSTDSILYTHASADLPAVGIGILQALILTHMLFLDHADPPWIQTPPRSGFVIQRRHIHIVVHSLLLGSRNNADIQLGLYGGFTILNMMEK